MATEVTSEPRVYMRHLRAAKICSGGARAWWSHNGLDWSAFLSDGIAGELLLKTGDPYAKRVVGIAKAEENGNR